MRRQGGQATVELALVLPLIVVLILAVVQVVIVLRDEVAVVNAARDAARAASLDADQDGPVRAARAGGLHPGRLRVAVRRAGGRVVVEVRYRSPTDIAVLGAMVPDVPLSARAEMVDETTVAMGGGAVV